MSAHGFTGRLAGATARHPWRTIGVWIVVLAGSILLATNLGSVLTEDSDATVQTESAQAQDLVDAHFSTPVPVGAEALTEESEYVLVEGDGTTIDDPAFAAVVDALVTDLRRLPTVVSAVSTLDGVPGLASEDGSVALVPVELAGEGEASDLAAPLVTVVDEANATPGFRVTTIGNGSVWNEVGALAEDTLQRGELLGVSLALVILALVFGALVAAGIPLLLAVASIIVALGLTVVVGQAFELSFFVVNMITMIGLAVGIDYSLFVVQRFREERAKGRDVISAVEHAGDSATRAVFFSGMTVFIALLGLLYAPDTVMHSLGIGAVLVVLAAVAASLTLLPAVLGLLGDRINRAKVPFVSGTTYHEGGNRFWHGVTRLVTARPLVSVLVAGGLLLTLATPYLSLHTGQNFIESLPEQSNARHAWTVLNDNFEVGAVTTSIVVEGDAADPAVTAAVAAMVADLDTDPAYGEITTQVSPDGEVVLIDAVTKLDPATMEARRAVEDLRTDIIPTAFAGTDTDVFVDGEAAWTADYVGVLNQRTPIIFAFVLGLSFLVLMTVFRSVVVPIKAILLNLLSVGAAYGLLVAVFQHGIGAGLFGFQQTDVIESWIPLFLFTVLFGLSMDYHIFLMSRIKERYDVTGDSDESVAFGLGSTGAIITGAALIMVAVFGGFAAGDMVMFQQMGFGLAVAVILDATVVRSVLVPAAMRLLGDRNWYLPRWLEWLPQVHIEGRPDPVPVIDLDELTDPMPELV
jgi:RND superfamily putative drug exporter